MPANQRMYAFLDWEVHTPSHLRALRSPRDPHPPTALVPIMHAINASWILLCAAGSAVAARKSHSRVCHFGVVFAFAVRELLAERLAVSKWWPAEAARYGDAIALVQRRARDVRTHALQLELSCWHKHALSLTTSVCVSTSGRLHIA